MISEVLRERNMFLDVSILVHVTNMQMSMIIPEHLDEQTGEVVPVEGLAEEANLEEKEDGRITDSVHSHRSWLSYH